MRFFVAVFWLLLFCSALAEMCAPIDRGFEASYGKYLLPVSATVKLQALHIAQGEGFRLDWVITAKVSQCTRKTTTHQFLLLVLSLGFVAAKAGEPDTKKRRSRGVFRAFTAVLTVVTSRTS